MVRLARDPLGDRAEVWQQDVLDLDLGKAIEAIVSTAALHWVTHHDRLWVRLARALRPGGRLEVQCAGQGNIARVRDLIATVAGVAPELVGRPPSGLRRSTRHRTAAATWGLHRPRCWLQERPTYPQDLDGFVRTSILPAHLARLPAPRRERFATAVVVRVRLPLDYVRLNVSAVRGHWSAARASALRLSATSRVAVDERPATAPREIRRSR